MDENCVSGLNRLRTCMMLLYPLREDKIIQVCVLYHKADGRLNMV